MNKSQSVGQQGVFSPLSKKQIRLWLQGFSCTWCKGATPYFTKKFTKQTRGIIDSGGNSWWVWNANSNYYKDWYE